MEGATLKQYRIPLNRQSFGVGLLTTAWTAHNDKCVLKSEVRCFALLTPSRFPHVALACPMTATPCLVRD